MKPRTAVNISWHFAEQLCVSVHTNIPSYMPLFVVEVLHSKIFADTHFVWKQAGM